MAVSHVYINTCACVGRLVVVEKVYYDKELAPRLPQSARAQCQRGLMLSKEKDEASDDAVPSNTTRSNLYRVN